MNVFAPEKKVEEQGYRTSRTPNEGAVREMLNHPCSMSHEEKQFFGCRNVGKIRKGEHPIFCESSVVSIIQFNPPFPRLSPRRCQGTMHLHPPLLSPPWHTPAPH
ncbi:hypothetical protein E2C01_055018 [Portunus trituberculatus]|uniref:Uncharacterized protein n=1 Tax=Portunus trituberculatus TaxID=210409 RepID=A0A5B7GTP8_PORTR|nr:hypothetical protein [Portunus trituberculatus]